MKSRKKRMKEMSKPTIQQFEGYQRAYDYFNEELFEGELKPCLLNFSRKSRSKGFFAPERWKSEGMVTHEISLNPDILDRDLDLIFSTLVHEMCHQWQFDLGEKYPKTVYHNKEWANKMLEVGLIPDDGKGKMTGQRVSHRIDEDGLFRKVFEKMPSDISLIWKSSARTTGEKEKKEREKKNKVKYECPRCGLSVWGKPNIESLLCGDCTFFANFDNEEDEEFTYYFLEMVEKED